jgi:hypothetical protein
MLKISLLLLAWCPCCAVLAPLPARAESSPGDAQSAPTPYATAPPPPFLDSCEREWSLQQRLVGVNADIRSLRAQDRAAVSPSPALAVTFTGAGIGVASAIPLVFWGALHPMPHGSPDDAAPPRAMLRTIAVAQITGVALTLGGLIALGTRLHQQPNRERVKQLESDRNELRRDLKLLRKERSQLDRLVPEAALGAEGGSFGIRYAFY